MRAWTTRFPVQVAGTPAAGATAVGTYVYSPVAGLRQAKPLNCAIPTTAESIGSMLTVIAAAVEEHTRPNAYGTRTRINLPSTDNESTPNESCTMRSSDSSTFIALREAARALRLAFC